MPDTTSSLLAAAARIAGPDTKRGVTREQLAEDLERLRTMRLSTLVEPEAKRPETSADKATRTEGKAG